MSQRFGIGKNPQVRLRAEQLAQTQARLSRGARRAARQVGPTSREARRVASERLTDARRWSAPRVDRAASYVEQEAAPKVGSILHRTADRLEPPSPRRSRRAIAGLLLLLIGGVVGTMGAIATRRNLSRDGSFSAPSGDRLSAVSENNTSERARTH